MIGCIMPTISLTLESIQCVMAQFEVRSPLLRRYWFLYHPQTLKPINYYQVIFEM